MSDKNEEKKIGLTLEDVDAIYDEDIELWNQEIADIEGLYQDMKKHYDQVKNRQSGSPGSFNFMLTQGENLIKLKETKSKMIKERVNTKKIKTDTKLSILRSSKDNTESQDFAAMAAAMYNEITSHVNSTSKETMVNPNSVSNISDADELLEQRLAELNERDNKKKEEEQAEVEKFLKEMEELKKQEEIPDEEEIEVEEIEVEEELSFDEILSKNNYKLVTNRKGIVIIVDEKYNEITDIEIPEEYMKIYFSVSDDDEIIAINCDGEYVEIVDF